MPEESFGIAASLSEPRPSGFWDTFKSLDQPCGAGCARFWRRNLLTILTFAGIVAGIAIGLILKLYWKSEWTHREQMYIGFLGEIFLNSLKFLILPIIAASVVSAIGSLNIALSAKIAWKAIIYYAITTSVAIVLGIVLVMTIKPGSRYKNVLPQNEVGVNFADEPLIEDTMLDLIRNMFPPNIIQAAVEQYLTKLIPSNETDNVKEWAIEERWHRGTNTLGVVVSSILFGVGIASIGDQSSTLLAVITELNEVVMRIVSWIIWVSPIGLASLVAEKVLEVENASDLAATLGLYTATVLVALLIHGFLILPLIYFLLTGKNPYRFMAGLSKALAIGFGASSSSAALPISLQCIEEKNGVDPRISRFVMSIGATINMDGTALYEAVAAIYVAQLRGYDLNIAQIIMLSITSTAAAIGAAGIPQAGMVTMALVLSTVGLPLNDISLIVAVDWLLDRFRTVTNVLGDAYGAGIVEHLCKKELLDVTPSRTDRMLEIQLKENKRKF